MRSPLYIIDGKLCSIEALHLIDAHKVIVISLQRCDCGECAKCHLDYLEERFVQDPAYRECECGLCLTCNMYKCLLGETE